MEQLDGMSMDIEQMQREKLRGVFPDCFSDGKLDIDKLLSLCGEYIDNDFEKYRFEWPGKAECLKLAQKRSTGTLRPCPEESKDWDTTQNLYIEGDNLEVLKLLQTAYFRRVKMIYIDPPYNTGNDFVYADNFADPLARYKEVTLQTTKSNPEKMGRFHTNWLNMMYPRLRLAANLLRDDGVCFISIDDNEVDNLKKLCNEVFGEENFVAQLIWERAFSPKNDAKFISTSHDYVLMYAKVLNSFTIGKLERTEEVNSRYKNPDNDPRGPWSSGDLTAKTYSAAYDYGVMTPSGKQVFPTSGRSWNTSEENMQKLIAEHRIWFGENGDNTPRFKRFLSEVSGGMVATSIMFYKDAGHSQEGRQELKKLFDNKGYFDGPKPVRFLYRLLKIGNVTDNDIVLDFFSGSATTAHAVMRLNAEDGGNRQFICVQLPELCDEKSEAYKAGFKNICEIGKERIRRAAANLNEELEVRNEQLKLDETTPNSNLDFGFKVFKLDSSNLKAWDSTPIPDDNLFTLYERMNDMIQNVKSERSDMDMVYEIMLKMGIPLTYPVKPVRLSEELRNESSDEKTTPNSSLQTPHSKTAYSVGEECLLLVCLAPQITPEDVEKMAELLPVKIVLSKNSFANDSTMSNAFYILRDRDISLKLV